MAQITDLEGLRSQVLKSLFGRRIGLDNDGYLVGPPGVRQPVMGVTDGSTLVSTASATVPAYGVSMVGSTGTSASTGLALDAPVPGVEKTLINVTTGQAVVGTTAAGAFICSTGSITSTFGTITMAAKGAVCELIGLTTALWGVKSVNYISTGGEAVTFV